MNFVGGTNPGLSGLFAHLAAAGIRPNNLISMEIHAMERGMRFAPLKEGERFFLQVQNEWSDAYFEKVACLSSTFADEDGSTA